MIPMVRTTEEMIRLVPHSLREAALALGYPRWRTSLSVVVRTCLPGIVTGSLLAIARVAETAAALHRARQRFMGTNVNEPMAALRSVYVYATRPLRGVAPDRLGHRAGSDPRGAVALLLARLATRQRFNVRQ
ncbi:MAG: ABC transporter permease subunit [Gemmatimonadales bacterium]